MYVLIMILFISGQGKAIDVHHLYYQNQLACTVAAQQFVAAQSHKFLDSDLRHKAFCIRGDE